MAKPLKDTEYLYASMRIKSMERNLLDHERIDRMIDARSHEDAAKVLYECGYGEMTEVTGAEWERVIAADRDAVYQLVSSLTSCPQLVNVFKMRYDYHNVKVLIKAEATGEDAERLLVDAGRMSTASLKDAVRDQKYTELPGLLKTMVPEAREVLSRTGDPQVSDFFLDAACMKEMAADAASSGSHFLEEYVALYVDIYNLRAVVRTVRLRRDPDFLRGVLVEGGQVSASRLMSAVTSGNALEDIYNATLLQEAAVAGVGASRGEVSLTNFERLTDNALMRQLSGAKHAAFGEQPLVGYLFAKEAEFTTIRTILSGRLAGLSPEAIRERLRDCYV